MVFEYNNHQTVLENAQNARVGEEYDSKLYDVNNNSNKKVISMAKFDKDHALDIMVNGTLEQKKNFINELANALNNKKYGLVWERGGTSEDSAFEAENVVLEYNKGIPYPKYRNDLSTNPNKANGNMLLEGDNYIWLKILEQTHAGKIDVIYIDPPYNTGKKDFKYNDRFVDENDTYRFSKWAEFMNIRLQCAYNLLKPEGVIFISIDEKALPELMMICYEIFGKANMIENFIWIKYASKNNSKTTSTNHEYVLCFAKNKVLVETKSFFQILKPGYDEVIKLVKQQKKDGKTPTDAQKALKQLYKQHPEWKGITAYSFVDDNWNIYQSVSADAPKATGRANVYDVLHPVTNLPCKTPSRGWGFTREKMEQLIKEGRILFGKDENTVPRQKYLLSTVTTDIIKSIIEDNTSGKKQLISIFGEAPFNNAKPTTLIKHLIQGFDKNIMVLDFFAGSGTTAHAVEELNKEDGGNRKWILITNNEDQEADDNNPETGICRDITKPRIDTVITGIRPDGSTYSDGTNSGYKYFQYDFIDRIKRQYERNSYSFFRPYIVDALIQLAYGVDTTIQDEQKMICVYENINQRIISFFGDTTPEVVQEVVDEYQTDDKTLIILLPEDCSSFKGIQVSQLQNGVEVKNHHSLITQAAYLQ